MDTVRFGRALGVGARDAAKALLSAADAAAAPTPSRAAQKPPIVEKAPPTIRQTVSQTVSQTVGHAKRTSKGVKAGGKRFGEAVWGPFVKLGGVLWLEFTGTFFLLFAVFAAAEAWKNRAALHDLGPNHTQHQHLVVGVAMAVVFGYFGISGFINASRRGRR